MKESLDPKMEPPIKKQKTEGVPSTKSDPDYNFSQDVDVEAAPSSTASYDSLVPEEMARLREFQVLDEVTNTDSEDSQDSDEGSEGIPEDELERMLDEDLPDELKGAPKLKEKPYITRQKVVLEEKGVNHFEVLPLDWVMVRHYSGMPVYIHRQSRVCTLAKPYFLGKGNTRRHDIPISAIPCLAYRRALQEEEKQKIIDKEIEEQIKNGTWKKDNDNKSQQNKVNGYSVKHKNSNINDKSFNYTSINEVNQNKDQNINAPKCPYKHNEVMDNQMNKDIHIKDSNIVSDKINEETNTHTQLNSDSKSVENNEKINEVIEIKSDNKESSTLKQNNESSILKANEESTTLKQNEESSTMKENEESSSMKENEESSTMKETEESSTLKEIPLNRQPVVLPGGVVMPPPRVETVNSSWKSQHLTPELLTEYCSKLFRFKHVNIMHFKRWADRRKYTKARKTLQYPTLPLGTKLITIPAQPSVPGQETVGGRTKRDWVMNMNGRSYLSVFHEYVRRALQKQPVYEFKQLENASQPYQATVYIGDMQYGVGRGSSKRAAKAAAARASIHILIPEMAQHSEISPTEPDFSFFDYVGIEDPRIMEFCAATCEPSPHAILRTCLLRNFGAGDRHIHTEMKKLEYQKIELTMKVGKHSATVVCKNKKSAKQRASQAILQALHPHVRSWGSLLRLYGSRSVKSCKEKKLEEQQITLLQDSARHNEPNYAVLEKLRNEMMKLRGRDQAVVSIGTLLVKDDLPTHSGSNLNNVDL